MRNGTVESLDMLIVITWERLFAAVGEECDRAAQIIDYHDDVGRSYWNQLKGAIIPFLVLTF